MLEPVLRNDGFWVSSLAPHSKPLTQPPHLSQSFVKVEGMGPQYGSRGLEGLIWDIRTNILDWDRMRGPYPGSMVLTTARNADNNIQQSLEKVALREIIAIVLLVIMIMSPDISDSSGFFTPAISNSRPGD